MNDLLLGVVFTFASWHIYPMCERAMSKMNEKQADINVCVVAVIFLILTIYTYVFVPMG